MTFASWPTLSSQKKKKNHYGHSIKYHVDRWWGSYGNELSGQNRYGCLEYNVVRRIDVFKESIFMELQGKIFQHFAVQQNHKSLSNSINSCDLRCPRTPNAQEQRRQHKWKGSRKHWPYVKVGDIEGELGVPVGFLDDPHRSIIPALSEPKLSEPRLDAREAVGVERLLLVRELLEPLLILSRRRERRRGRRGRNQRSPPAPPPPEPPQGRWGLEARGQERGKRADAGEEGGFAGGKGCRVYDG